MNFGDFNIRVRQQQQQQGASGATGPQQQQQQQPQIINNVVVNPQVQGPQQQPQIEVEEIFDPNKTGFGELQAFVARVKRDNPNAGPLKVVVDMEKTGDDKPILNVVNKKYSGHMVFKVCTADGRVLDTLKRRQPSTQKVDPNASDSDKSAAVSKARDEIMLTCHAYETAINGQATDEKIKLLRKNLALGQFGLVREGGKIKLAVTVREFITTVKKSKIKGKPDELIKSEKQRTIELPNIVYEKVIGQNNVVTWKKVNTEEPIDFNGNKKAWNEYQPPVFLKDDKTEELLHSDNIVQDIDVGGREQRSGKLGKLIEHTRRESNSLDKKLISVKNNLVDEQGDLKGGYKSYLEHEKLHLPNAVPPEGSLEKKIRDHQNSIPQLNTLKQTAETKLAMLTRIEAELDSGRAGTTGPSEALDDFRFGSNINITDNRQYNDPLIKEKIKKAIAASRRENTINKQEADKEIATKNKLISEQKKELFEAGRPYKMALVSLDETQASLTAMRNQYKKLIDDHGEANNLFKLSVDDLAAVKAEYNNLTDKISAVIKFKADLKSSHCRSRFSL